MFAGQTQHIAVVLAGQIFFSFRLLRGRARNIMCVCVCDINSNLLPKLNYFQLQNNSQLSLLYSFCFSVIGWPFVVVIFIYRFCFLFLHLFFSEFKTDRELYSFAVTGDRHSLNFLPMARYKTHTRINKKRIKYFRDELYFLCLPLMLLSILANFNGQKNNCGNEMTWNMVHRFETLDRSIII